MPVFLVFKVNLDSIEVKVDLCAEKYRLTYIGSSHIQPGRLDGPSSLLACFAFADAEACVASSVTVVEVHYSACSVENHQCP